ncbi:MAG: hypothetical protein HZA92_01845 [Verrucomicrobia bacterium]|nr:hypothetical protein [Verrucomicrobiota bacterium]
MSGSEQACASAKQTRRHATLGCMLFGVVFAAKAAADYQVLPLPIMFLVGNFASSFGVTVALARITQNCPQSGPKSFFWSAGFFLFILAGPLYLIPSLWLDLLLANPMSFAAEITGLTRDLAQSQGMFASFAGCFLGMGMGERLFPRNAHPALHPPVTPPLH